MGLVLFALLGACSSSGVDGPPIELDVASPWVDVDDGEDAGPTFPADAPAPDDQASEDSFTDTGVDGGKDTLVDVGMADTAMAPDPGTMSDTLNADIQMGPDTVSASACPWESAGGSVTALLTVELMDVWGQNIPSGSLWLWGPASQEVAGGGTLLSEVPLCATTQLSITATATHYHLFTGVITYDGQAGEDSLQMAGDPLNGAWLVTMGKSAGVTHYRIYLAAAHRYFASTGPPARAGNTVELFLSPADAFESFFNEAIANAWEEVTISTWWWESLFELYRDPDMHVFQNEAQRYPNTAIALMEFLASWDVDVRILVNQFLSQDGFWSEENIDDALIASVEAGEVEMMGQFNASSGVFNASMPAVNLQERLAEAGILPKGKILVNHALPPLKGPITVDMSDLPLGLSAFEIPLASWHQKFFTIDQKVAYIGGLNFQWVDWETSEMNVYDPRRMAFDASLGERLAVLDKEALPDFPTRRDYMVRVEGPLVRDAMAVFHARWNQLIALGATYSDLATAFELAEVPAAQAGGVKAQLVTTMPAPYHRFEILETLLRAIAQADDYILIEDQYFRAPLLADAIVKRLQADPDLVVIVLSNPVGEWTDPACWQTYLELNQLTDVANGRIGFFQLRSFDWFDTGCTLCWDEVAGVFMDTFIHSKMVIIDDLYVQVGSANHNNRGLLYEGEMATVVVDEAWAEAARHSVVSALIGPAYAPNTSAPGLLTQFEVAAAWNDYVYDNWQAEGWDLNLNGGFLPGNYLPQGPIYSYPFSDPSACFFEGVGGDVM